MTLYLVTFNGFMDEYGAEIYLIGIFDNLEDATNAIPKNKEEWKYYKIHAVNLNEELQVRSKNFPCRYHIQNSYETDIFLGGYVE